MSACRRPPVLRKAIQGSTDSTHVCRTRQGSASGAILRLTEKPQVVKKAVGVAPGEDQGLFWRAWSSLIERSDRTGDGAGHVGGWRLPFVVSSLRMAADIINPVARILLPWCIDRLERAGKLPFILGLQGPQGCGKSTAAAAVVEGARRRGWSAVTVSIDDFYLTRAEQTALAARHADNPFLSHRGYPGTHDVALGVRTLDALAGNTEGSEVLVPGYDKAAHGGRGDRAPAASWRRVVGRPDVVIVEGWMLGFSPVEEGGLAPNLVAPNRYLAAYRAWTERLHALLHLDAPSPEAIVAWRVDAERARREHGEGALSDAEATDYILRFLPAYDLYVPALRAQPPCADFLRLTLGTDRKPVATREP